MSFVPITLGSGLTGWNFLKQTAETQKNLLSVSASTSREVDHFRSVASKLITPTDLVNDRTALTVALGSVGLEDDLENKFFIERVLKEGTSSATSLANLLSDTRYAKFADRFDLNKATGLDMNTVSSTISSFVDNRFTTLVGDQEPDLRLALNLQSGLKEIGSNTLSNDGKWFSIMGNPPIRKVFEVALNLPNSVSNLSIDDQLKLFRDRSEAVFSQDDVIALTANQLDEITERFLTQAQLSSAAPLSSGAVALAILSNVT